MFNKVKLKKYLIGMFAAIILMSAVITAAGAFGLLQLKSGMDTLINEELRLTLQSRCAESKQTLRHVI